MIEEVELVAEGLAIDKSTWTKTKFGDVAIQQKENVDRENTELTRYIAGEHMGSEDLHIRSWGEVNDDYLGPAFHRKFEAGDILYGSRRTYLRKVAVAHFDGITANTTFVIKPNEDLILKELLPFVMLSEGFAEHSIKNSKGSVNPYVNWKDIASYEFLLPPIDQQEQIAELLWAGDNLLQKYTVTLDELKNLKLAIRRNIVCDNNHQRKTLSEVLTGITAGKSLNGRNVPVKGGEKGVLKVSAVGAEGFEHDENKVLNNQGEFLPRFIIRKNDLLITRANTTELVGRVCLVDDEFSNLMLCDKTLRLEVKENTISKLFLLEALLSSEVRSQIEDRATGTGGAMKNISQSEIMSLKVPLPDYSIQKSIAEKLSRISTEYKILKETIQHYTKLQKSIINQTF